jgi:hypothetical protein
MNTIEKSSLETAVLERFYDLYRAQGFPAADSIRAISRENTGGGRYIQLECSDRVQLPDGYIDLAGSFIEMKDLPNGMMAVVLVKDNRVAILELTVYGGDHWDGEERDWRIV